MRLLTLLSSLLLLVALPLTTFAQTSAEVDLDETYTDPNGAFAFNYPADWVANADPLNMLAISLGSVENLAAFDAPIASTGEQGNSQGIAIETSGMTIGVFADFESSATLPEDYAADLLRPQADGEVFILQDPLLYTLNDHPLALVKITSSLGIMDTALFSMQMGEGQFITLGMAGNFEQISLATPIAFEILNTIRLAGDETPIEVVQVRVPLPQSYTRPDDTATFDYPANWTVEEADGYTLIFDPSGQLSLGISLEPAPVEIRESVAVDVAGVIRQNILDSGSAAQASEISTFEINGYAAARVSSDDGEIVAMFMVIDYEDETMGLVSVVGEGVSLRDMEPEIYSIAASVRPPKTEK